MADVWPVKNGPLYRQLVKEGWTPPSPDVLRELQAKREEQRQARAALAADQE